MKNCPACNHPNDPLNTSCENCGSLMTAIYKISPKIKPAAKQNQTDENRDSIIPAAKSIANDNIKQAVSHVPVDEYRQKMEKHKTVFISIISLIAAAISVAGFITVFNMRGFELYLLGGIASAIVAIITGIITRRRIKSSGTPNRAAFGISFAGIVTGYITAGIPVVFITYAILILLILGDEHGVPDPYPYLWQTVTLFTIPAVLILAFICGLYFTIKKLRRILF